MAIFPVVKLKLVKCRQRFGCLPWGKRPTLAKHGRRRLFQNKRWWWWWIQLQLLFFNQVIPCLSSHILPTLASTFHPHHLHISASWHADIFTLYVQDAQTISISAMPHHISHTSNTQKSEKTVKRHSTHPSHPHMLHSLQTADFQLSSGPI